MNSIDFVIFIAVHPGRYKNPSVVPLFGSTPTSGTGMNGAVAGLNHLASQGGAGAGGYFRAAAARTAAPGLRRCLRRIGRGWVSPGCGRHKYGEKQQTSRQDHPSNRAKQAKSISTAIKLPMVEMRNKINR